jgi:hypothetical protein
MRTTDRYDDNNSSFSQFLKRLKKQQHSHITNVNLFILFGLVCDYDNVLAFLARNTYHSCLF